MLNRVHTIIFFTDNIDDAAAWYANIIDAEVEYENPKYAYVSGNGFILGFHPADEKNPAGNSGSVAYFEVDDITETLNAIQTQGAELYRGPYETDLRETTAMLRDPFGNVFALHQTTKP